ncbi:hypothetical protein ACFWO6_27205 [Paenibacillus glucanolyticus]|uniref:hypothetical protein n=1 Tax=Paenibacillus glucanolyticus TaxID=59843 RepID=UPI00365F0828
MARLSDFLTASDKSRRFFEREAKKNWMYWRLVFEGGLSPSEVDLMDWDELQEANAALDMFPVRKVGVLNV